jgi:hypothetical protein
MRESYMTVDSNDIEKFDIDEKMNSVSKNKAFVFD